MKKFEDRYLGDGVYVSFDGYQFWLDIRGEDPTKKIAIPPFVLDAFNGYASMVAKKTLEVESPLEGMSNIKLPDGTVIGDIKETDPPPFSHKEPFIDEG